MQVKRRETKIEIKAVAICMKPALNPLVMECRSFMTHIPIKKSHYDCEKSWQYQSRILRTILKRLGNLDKLCANTIFYEIWDQDKFLSDRIS